MHNQRERIRQCGGFVATALGPEWTVDTTENYDHAVTIRREDGIGLFLRVGAHGADQGRLIITGTFPKFDRRVDSPRITVAFDRDPGKIARDIERRLLPGYLEAFKQAQVFAADDERAAASKAEAARQLAALGATGNADDRLYLSLPGYGYGTVHLTHDGARARIEFASVSLKATVAAIEAILSTQEDNA